MLGGELYHGDCLEIMPRIPRESVDLVLCDLPYGTTASTWDRIIPMDKLWAEYTRVLKPRGTVALFCVQPFTSLLVTHGLKGKLHYRYMWVWLKSNKTNCGQAHKQPLRRYEEIAVFGKAAGKYNPQNTKKAGRAYTVATADGERLPQKQKRKLANANKLSDKRG